MPLRSHTGLLFGGLIRRAPRRPRAATSLPTFVLCDAVDMVGLHVRAPAANPSRETLCGRPSKRDWEGAPILLDHPRLCPECASVYAPTPD